MEREGTDAPVDASKLMSEEFLDYLLEKEAKSLSLMKEVMGVVCLSKNGKMSNEIGIDAESTDTSARSKASIVDIGNKCNEGEEQVWWHTHNNTLSVLSADDRLSGGDLKALLGTNLVCAAGIEGYSCHQMNKNPPRVIHNKWSDQQFERLKEKSSTISDLNAIWKLEDKNEVDVHHILCTGTHGSGVNCTGIDWETGFAEFEIGTTDQLIVTGNADISTRDGGFDIIASSIDKKLECFTIKSGQDKKILYCR